VTVHAAQLAGRVLVDLPRFAGGENQARRLSAQTYIRPIGILLMALGSVTYVVVLVVAPLRHVRTMKRLVRRVPSPTVESLFQAYAAPQPWATFGIFGSWLLIAVGLVVLIFG
jgi:hypothetical protein